MDALYSALATLALILLRALVLSADTGLSSASTEALKELPAPPQTLATFVRLKARPEATFAALRSVMVLTICLAATFGAAAGALALTPLLSRHLSSPAATLVGLLVGGAATALFTTIIDLAARALASASPARVAARFARPMSLLTRLASPVLSALAFAIDPLVKPLGAQTRFGPPAPPLEDLERLLVEEAKRLNIDPQGPKLIRNIFGMSEKTARDVMVPRTEVIALEIATAPARILDVLAEHGHSRIPVFRREIDQIVGILHARDLVPMLAHPELIVVEDAVRPAHYIPWSEPVGEILREMQRKHIHMALVVDEYGGFLGIVTLEDVLEVIVGDLSDEYGEDTPDIDPASDGSFLVRAAIGLEQFERAFSVEIPEGAYETLGGFLNSLSGSIPESGDKFFCSGLQLTVIDRTPRKVRRVRVQRVASGESRRRVTKDGPAEAAAATASGPGPRHAPASPGPASPAGSASSGT